MASRPLAPPPPVLPVSGPAHHQLDQLAAALASPDRPAPPDRAGGLPPAATEALALAADPGFRRLAAGFRALEARGRASGLQADPPRGLRTLLARLERRYPQAFGAFRALAGVAEPPDGVPREDGNDVKAIILVPHSVVFIVLVPGRARDEPGRAFLEALARLDPAPRASG